MFESLTRIQRAAPEAVLAGLKSDSPATSSEAAVKLIAQASSYGLGLRDYLTLAIDPRQAKDPQRYLAGANGELLNGYEAALFDLGLPSRNDFEGGITLQLAADTFQTFTGVRALFPEVIDDMIRWTYRQTEFENLAGIISNTRTINGNEILSTVMLDTQADYEESVRAVPEGGRIPIHSIKASQNSVKFWKFGTGYKTTYEFNRRVALDYLTPYAIRTQVEINRSKVAVATHILLNGDGVHGAAPVVNQADFSAKTGMASVAGKLGWKNLVAWLVAQAQAGVAIDTVLGNWDAYLQWLWLFEVQPNGGTFNDAENLARSGFKPGGVPILNGSVNFKLSTTMPDNQLLGFAQPYTIEQLVEGGSLITESERSIKTQEITYVKSENSGFRLPFGDTRSVYDYSQASA